ncbi:MAG TPA: hypothetical protein VJ756_02210 [Terriglobales bacterium]|nr:hypothetical protein [Terriglobales bacterium]
MGAEVTYGAGKNRFAWGLVLAWAPAIPFIIGMSRIFRGISEQKATGIGAVVGGFVEAYFLFGIVATFAFQVGGIVLLMKSTSNGQRFPFFLSFASIAWSTLMLILLALFLWLNFAFPLR